MGGGQKKLEVEAAAAAFKRFVHSPLTRAHPAGTAEVCVCDLALLGMTQSAVSHQLRVLKQARLIKGAARDGKTVFYSLADDHVATLLRQGMEHVCEGSRGGECGNNQSSA